MVYTLTYFNVRGLAEMSRLILHYAQVPFNDVRIEKADWPSLKPSKLLFPATESRRLITCVNYSDTPFGQLPNLEVDGKVLAQSFSIARFLAKEHGLAGKDHWEQAEADMYVDCVGDMIGGECQSRLFKLYVLCCLCLFFFLPSALRPTFAEQDESKKKELLTKINSETIQPLLAKIEKHLADNGNSYLVGKSV